MAARHPETSWGSPPTTTNLPACPNWIGLFSGQPNVPVVEAQCIALTYGHIQEDLMRLDVGVDEGEGSVATGRPKHGRSFVEQRIKLFEAGSRRVISLKTETCMTASG